MPKKRKCLARLWHFLKISLINIEILIFMFDSLIYSNKENKKLPPHHCTGTLLTTSSTQL